MVDDDVIIKRVTTADADVLLTFSRKTFYDFFAHLNDAANMETYASAAFTPQKIQDELNNPGSEFYFAILNGQVTGYLKINFGMAQTELNHSNSLEVERIYVSAEHHGKKIGHRLLNFALQTAKDKGLNSVWLGVWEHNHKALSFYEKHGFTTFGSHPFMLGNEKQIDLLMRKEIE